MTYTDVKGDGSERMIWPLALGFFEEVHVVVAWCELRQDFRHFQYSALLSENERLVWQGLGRPRALGFQLGRI